MDGNSLLSQLRAQGSAEGDWSWCIWHKMSRCLVSVIPPCALPHALGDAGSWVRSVLRAPQAGGQRWPARSAGGGGDPATRPSVEAAWRGLAPWEDRFQASNLESSLMCEVLGPQQGSASGSSGSSSITACKKVLRSNSLLESTDYWLQNQRTPCQIGFVEDKSENCASICFVNLDVNKDECSPEHLQQKLVNVSPDLPKLISSMNVQQPKENEIVLLSGLTSGNLQSDLEVSQCTWRPDICLVQCARGNRPNRTDCIIFEINKFLIGLELVQERQLHLETNILKVEDDTNCSLSSIEEDFLTASEHLEEESEVEEFRNGNENVNVSANVLESKMRKESTQEEWNPSKEMVLYTLKDKGASKYQTPLIKMESSLGKEAEDKTLQHLDVSAKLLTWKGDTTENEKPITKHYHSEKSTGQVNKTQAQYTPGDSYLSRMLKKAGPSACGPVTELDYSKDPGSAENGVNSLPPILNGEATTGLYATNLAESVLQDAFIRLSQCQPTLLQESAISVPVGSPLLPSGCSTSNTVVPRSWDELPKIVIVQSPEGSDASLEPSISSLSEADISVEISGVPSGQNSSRHPQSAVEIALTCAATVIGTISSPQATERFKMEQESLVSRYSLEDDVLLQTQTHQMLKEPSISEYSFPSALCGMTQVASAVAICGLGDTGEMKSPEASSGLFSEAEDSTATSSLGTLTTRRSLELGSEAIAEALLKEASLVLTRPDTYSSIGELVGSMTKRFIDTASEPQAVGSADVPRNELAQTLSNIILKHSMDEAYQKSQPHDPNSSKGSSETLDSLVETTNQLLFNVICFTFKKMAHMIEHGEGPTALFKETVRWRGTERACQPTAQPASQAWTNATESSCGHPLSHLRSTGLVIPDFVDDMHSIQPKQDINGPARPGLFKSPKLQSELPCNPRAPDCSMTKTAARESYLKGSVRQDAKTFHPLPCSQGNEYRSSSGGERSPAQGPQGAEVSIPPNIQEKYLCISPVNSEAPVSLSLLGTDWLLPAPAMLQTKHRDVGCIAEFAEELAETIVSMATEMAAICLDNSNGKQPWFCAWRRGSEFLVTPNVSCRMLKRKKDSQMGGVAVRKHKPPRLSEIKRKTDEHPELKEKLMNRVVDESVNLEDLPDPVNVFANEVAAKIMNLSEYSVVDGVWQAQSFPRGRLLSGDHWSRLKASSCDSIPEEDSSSRACAHGVGLMSTLSQPVSRASSMSKQSSCESITEEFSRFMVNQMENEGWGFELLLDYYAGKTANSILSSAMQQACRKNEHLSVRSNCPSKQSSTESITEEFYRYMLRDMERDSKDREGTSSRRSSQDWSPGFLSPSLRSPLCYRQSSVPDSRSLGSRLTVNAPIKANSLDGFAQNSQQDFLSVQPVSSASSSGFCRSDSCLYQRRGTDQITTMLIRETWANSIQALMRKNKIISDDTEARDAEPGSPVKADTCVSRSASSRAQSRPALVVQESANYPRRDSLSESKHPPVNSPSKCIPLINSSMSDSRKETSCCEMVSPSQPQRSVCSREVPLIQIETDQREECAGETEQSLSKSSPLEKAEEALKEEKVTADMVRVGDTDLSSWQAHRGSFDFRDVAETEVTTEGRAPGDFSNPSGSSGGSMDSWSQLANEEDNPDDTSSFLQLSERSMSELVEEKEILKGQSETTEEHAPGLPGVVNVHQGSLLVINFDLEPECPDAELRATLQWIAASELGIPTIYFKKSQENRIEKFLDVVRLVHQKSWKVGDIFHAVVQYCKMHEEQKEGTPSLFDWLLELG
ncbi:A-kinase anchor protein SPHKAP isoform X3 [Erinaceus europaeus]|uniref:A-kinase anchor protein SPHKAP isoform X3 n=1 Tax=Erinaceus europaeus TaxID=9365 RepID=A0ABM3XLH5_ERIEU|nr:A-kinase anchor protein SPHKAP isoform X3 [Erinaceus europaeus]